MNIQRHTSLLDRSPGSSGVYPGRKMPSSDVQFSGNQPSQRLNRGNSNLPRRAMSPPVTGSTKSMEVLQGSRSLPSTPTPYAQPSPVDSDDVILRSKQPQPFQRSGLRSSFSSVRSDSSVPRKAVSFGGAVKYEFNDNRTIPPPRRSPNEQARPNHVNGGPNPSPIPKYSSLPLPRSYASSAVNNKSSPVQNTQAPNPAHQDRPRNSDPGFPNGIQPSKPFRPQYSSPNGRPLSGTKLPIYSHGYQHGLPIVEPTSNRPLHPPTLSPQHGMPANKIASSLGSPSSSPSSGIPTRHSSMSPTLLSPSKLSDDEVFLRGPPANGEMPVIVQSPTGGLKPTDWSDSDGGPNHRRTRPMKREEIRRHTLAGENAIVLPPTHSQSMDPIRAEGPSHLYTQRSHSMYQPPSSIYDDDPGIMSEAETSATGFRRGGKQRSSLPVVRTPNKSLERPLGLVFLQYRSETKRALLPNEITSLDTVKAIFVRSFPCQLTMEYLESPHLRIYIHDPSKDMFYELEDLRDIKDRSVLRIYEQDVNGGPARSTWDQDTSYFSEPEFDSEYQHQHIHRAKAPSKSPAPSSNYYGIAHTSYVGTGRTATLPHPGSHRAYSPAVGMNDRVKTQTLPLPGSDVGSRTLPLPGSMQPPPKPQRAYQQPVTSMAKSVRATPPPHGPPPPAPSPRTNQAGTSDRRIEHHRSYPMYLTPSSSYDDPYYSDRTYGSRSGSITPVIDEEARRDGYLLPAHGVQSLDHIRYRARVEYMERQLASLTGLVHKALTTSRPPPLQRDIEINLSRELLQVPTNRDAVAIYKGSGGGEVCEVKPSVASSSPAVTDECKTEPKTIPRPLSKEEKSVSFSDDPPTMSSPTHTKQHSPQHTDLQITPEMYNQLRLLKKKTKDLRVEVRNLRRITQAQALNIKETIRETFIKIKAMLAAVEADNDQIRAERNKVSREEEMYKQDITQLEKNLSDLEQAVEDLRSNVINRRCRVNMSEVENMALVLSKASKMVADLKVRYPSLQENLKSVMAAEMEVIVREEKFLKEEPDRLENALRRCKKLTGTLVTLKRLASVQEQRLPPTSPGLEQRAASLPSSASVAEQQFDGLSIGPDGQISKAASFSGEVSRQSSVSGDSSRGSVKGENALDALLDELQIAAKPGDRRSDGYTTPQLPNRLPSYPSSDSPLKGQIVSQGPTGSVSLTVTTTAPINKLQVNDGSRQVSSLSPVPSPMPLADGKVSPQPPEVFSRVGVRQTVIEGPNGTGPEKGSSLSPAGTGGIAGQIKKVPPPPPPRTSSKSPLVSPTSPMSPSGRLQAMHAPRSSSLPTSVYTTSGVNSVEPSPRASVSEVTNGFRSRKSSSEASQSAINNGEVPVVGKDGPGVLRTVAISDENLRRDQLSSNSSSSESVNSQEGIQTKQAKNLDGHASDAESKKTPPTPPTRNRQEILEQRHQELLRRQRQLQEQYARLQQLQRGQTLQRFSPPRSPADLKKTGSESNILSKAGLAMSATSGSLTHLAPIGIATKTATHNSLMTSSAPSSTSTSVAPSSGGQTTSKIYETDIL